MGKLFKKHENLIDGFKQVLPDPSGSTGLDQVDEAHVLGCEVKPQEWSTQKDKLPCCIINEHIKIVTEWEDKE